MREYLVYTAGGITGLTYDEANDWRKYVKEKVNKNIKTLSPMRGKQRFLEIQNKEVIKQAYEENPLTSNKGINTRDYNDVKRSDAIFVNFLGATRVSIGTVMEIAWARAFQIPVILVMEKENNPHEHIMLTYCCGFRVDTLDKGIEILNTIIGPDEFVENEVHVK